MAKQRLTQEKGDNDECKLITILVYSYNSWELLAILCMRLIQHEMYCGICHWHARNNMQVVYDCFP